MRILNVGDQVRQIDNPSKVGTIKGTQDIGGDVFYRVKFSQGVSTIHGDELEPVKEENVEDLISNGRYGRVRDLRRNITHVHLNGHLDNLVYSMDATNTDFYAYQFKPVLSFLESPSRGLLIADEVGLGKTIEAGLIWTELRARYDARRLLVVCPAMLCEKWRTELSVRFGVEAEIVNAEELHNKLKVRGKTADGKGFICSLQGLRPPKNWESEEQIQNRRSRLATFFTDSSEENSLFDLVIIDEAHYLRNPASQTAKLGQMLRGVTDNLVLLSATPINLNNEDLFQLLNLVDPDSFARVKDFDNVLEANKYLIKARDKALDLCSEGDDITALLGKASAHPLLKKSKQLSTLVQTNVDDFLETRADRVLLANQIEKINLLSHALTRTRKVEVNELRVTREPNVYYIDLDEDGPEKDFYHLTTDSIRKYALKNGINDGFLLAGPQRQASSCFYAAAKSWSNKNDRGKQLEGISEQLYEDLGEDRECKDTISPLIEHLSSTVLPEIDLDQLRECDSKYKKFRQVVFEYLDLNPDKKIIVFSYFRMTLYYLGERLKEDNKESQILVGGMKEDKQEIITLFKKSKNVRILLSSEVASEGVDLQFCEVLVNYDLPWNPMKVEQRIGRIDRIGQESEIIHILNLLHKDTIDHKIYDRLYERLKIFERALGGMEAVLGDEIRNLTRDFLSAPLTPQQEDDRAMQSANALEHIKAHEERVEAEASHLIAHGGYILDNVQAAHNLKKQITEKDLILYVKDYLLSCCKGYEFVERKGELSYMLRLPPETAALFDDFIKRFNHHNSRLATGDDVELRFSSKVKGANQQEEVINQFHPFIRFISHEMNNKITLGEGGFYPLVACKVTENVGQEIERGVYAFTVKRWVFRGLSNVEELAVRAINLETKEVKSRELSWSIMNHARVNGEDYLEVKNRHKPSMIKNSLDKCEEQIIYDFKSKKEIKENENYDRIAFQVQSAERHRDRQLKALDQTILTLTQRKQNKMIPAAEGKKQKVQTRFKTKEEGLKLKSNLDASAYDVCCGVICIGDN